MKKLQTLLIAKRGEIAIRVRRSAALLGTRTVTVTLFSEDDALSLHTRMADAAPACFPPTRRP